MTGRSKGFGFVEYENEADAGTAVTKLNGSELDGRTITVQEARPREDNRFRVFLIFNKSFPLEPKGQTGHFCLHNFQV